MQGDWGQENTGVLVGAHGARLAPLWIIQKADKENIGTIIFNEVLVTTMIHSINELNSL